jgi:pyruvate, water dikinase
MVAGAEVSMFRPEEELCRLSRLAMGPSKGGGHPQGEDGTAAEKMNALKGSDEGNHGWKSSKGSRTPGSTSPAAADGITTRGAGSTRWTSPSAIMQSYMERLEKGEKDREVLGRFPRKGSRIVEEYKETHQDRTTTGNPLTTRINVVRSIYVYAEDHLFWVEHWLHTIWFKKIREFGNVLTKYNGLTKSG